MECGGSDLVVAAADRLPWPDELRNFLEIATDLFDREAVHIRSRTCETILTDVRLCDFLREKLTPRTFEGADVGGGGGLASAAADLNVTPPAE